MPAGSTRSRSISPSSSVRSSIPTTSPTFDELQQRLLAFQRLYTEESQLPAWGRAALAGDGDAGLRLAALGRIGRAFAERTHDSMVADTVAMIERAPEVRKLALASGLVAFGGGWRATAKWSPRMIRLTTGSQCTATCCRPTTADDARET